MSTRTKTVTVHVCHSCGADCDYPYVCGGCGQPFCFSCRDKGIEYPHAVFFSGSDDGFYCKPCDRKLSRRSSDQVYLAYRKIGELRAEAKRWNEDFEKRTKAAQEELQRLRKTEAA